jgi:sterol desaturase/sphingolipid hydroxylase (fatty acid hydroxylase superfamily)
VLVYELAHYWYHRAAHRFDWLWRATHQMHHSAESVEALGAYYLHPLDTALFSTWSALVFFPLLGLGPVAAAVASAFLAFNAVFQHANIRTPRWVGFLVQRPESHGVHHERGVHRFNYADLPLWDVVFGTFRNPAQWAGQGGFYVGASSRLAEMLVGRDVTMPSATSATSGATTDEAVPRAA